ERCTEAEATDEDRAGAAGREPTERTLRLERRAGQEDDVAEDEIQHLPAPPEREGLAVFDHRPDDHSRVVGISPAGGRAGPPAPAVGARGRMRGPGPAGFGGAGCGVVPVIVTVGAAMLAVGSGGGSATVGGTGSTGTSGRGSTRGVAPVDVY